MAPSISYVLGKLAPQRHQLIVARIRLTSGLFSGVAGAGGDVWQRPQLEGHVHLAARHRLHPRTHHALRRHHEGGRARLT